MKYPGMYIYILVLLLLAACSGDAGLSGVGNDEPTGNNLKKQKASTSIVRAEGMLDVTFPVACVGENVRVFGPITVRIHTTHDGNGKTHQMAYYNWKEVIATALTSGKTWHTTAALELYTMLNYEPVEPHQPAPNRISTGEPAVFHHTGAIRLISDSDTPDLYVRHLVQNVIDDKGNVRVDTDLLELLECR